MDSIMVTLKKEINKILQKVVKESRANLIAKGHKDTGELHNSVGARVELQGGELMGEVSFLMYGLSQDKGISAGKIPYNQGSGASRSKYIDALTAWVKRKGMSSDAKEAKGIAFAIAKKHKKFGMPLDKSKLGWFSETIDKNQSSIDSAIDVAVGESLELVISSLVDETNKGNKK